MSSSKGKLIVIEGIDGSGKTTQFDLIVKNLKDSGKKIKTFDFPRHETYFFGLMVDDYLNGKFGDPAKLNPYLASMIYTLDRWEVKDKLCKWLSDGYYVILDRYATSNVGHQAGKLSGKKRDKYLDWLEEIEYEVMGNPKPDLVLFLSMSISHTQRLIQTRKDKKYIKGKIDKHESNIKHLTEAREAYKYACHKYTYWHEIICNRGKKLLSVKEINQELLKLIK